MEELVEINRSDAEIMLHLQSLAELAAGATNQVSRTAGGPVDCGGADIR
jgi:hypothetical protein